MNAKRNGKIEVMRFIFAIAVVLYHCQKNYMSIDRGSLNFAFFARGYIGVEFFFLLTGFFMARSVYKIKDRVDINYDIGKETISYTWRKIKGILPWHFVAFAILFLATAILEKYSIRMFIRNFIETIPNLLLFSKAGFNFKNLNSVEWYISCMIFAIIILYPICRKWYSVYTYIIAPVGGLFLLGYLTENFGTFTDASRWNGIVFTCVLRAIAEIGFGVVTFEISRVLGEKCINRIQKKLFTAIEIFCYIFVFVYVMSTAYTRYEIYALFAMMIAISLTLSNQVYGNKIFDRNICYFLGKASLPIYLSQVLPLNYRKAYLKDYSVMEPLIIVLVLTLVNAGVCVLII